MTDKNNKKEQKQILKETLQNEVRPYLLAMKKIANDGNDILRAIQAKNEASKLIIKFDNKELPYLQGEQGEKGEKGDRGEQGIQGERGAKGIAGSTGKQGLRGLIGETGPQGERGLTGLRGEKGEKGERGIAGRNGSVIEATEVRDKLESLKGRARLKISAINGLQEELDALKLTKRPSGGDGGIGGSGGGGSPSTGGISAVNSSDTGISVETSNGVVTISSGNISAFTNNAGYLTSSSIPTYAWSRSGNANTTAGTDFIGTTDNNDFVTKTNGIERIRTNTNGLTGFGTVSPTATGHFAAISESIAAPTSATLSYQGGASGYTIGFYSQYYYTIYASKLVGATRIYSNAYNTSTGDAVEANFAPTSFDGAISYTGSGISNMGQSLTYDIYAIYSTDSSPTVIGTKTVTFDGVSGDGVVDLSWVAPVYGNPTEYWIVQGGNYVVVSAGDTSYQDLTGSFGTGFMGVSSFYFSIYIQTSPVTGADQYGYENTTNFTYQDGLGDTATDANSWSSGSPASSPTTADYSTLYSEGDSYFTTLGASKLLSFYGVAGAVQQSGNLITALSNYGLVTGGLIDTSNIASRGTLSGTSNQVVLSGSGANALAFSSNITLSLPQNIHTTATPQFQRMGLGVAANSTQSFSITIGTNTHKGVVIKGAASQSGNLLELQNSSSTLLSVFTSDGRLGIGGAPDAGILLHEKTSGNAETILESTGGTTPYAGYSLKSTTGKWGMFVGGASHPSIDGDFGIYDWDAGVYRMVIKDDGKIGIGNTAPTYNLTLGNANTMTSSGGFGGASASIQQLISGTGSGSYTQLAIQGPTNGGAAIEIYDGSGVAVMDFGMNTAASEAGFINRMTSGLMSFYTHNGTSLARRFYINATGDIGIAGDAFSTPKLRVMNSGLVGIGNTAPGALLDVNGCARYAGTSTVPTASGVGDGLELWYYNGGGGPYGVVLAYNRDTSTYKPIRIAGSEIGFEEGATRIMTVDDGKVNFNVRANFASVAGTTAEGDIWSDSTQKALQTYVNGIEQTLNGTIYTQTADKTVANTVVDTSIIGTGVGTVTLPANFLVAGKSIDFKVMGYHSSTGNPTITVKIKLGSTVVATGTATSGNGTTNGFTILASVTCRTTGATGTVASAGMYQELHNGGAYEGLVQTGTTTIDTTVTQVFDVTVTWGTASASNTITSQESIITIAN